MRWQYFWWRSEGIKSAFCEQKDCDTPEVVRRDDNTYTGFGALKAIRIIHDCKEPNLGKFTTCGDIQLSSPPVLWGYKTFKNKQNFPEMNRSRRVDNSRAQEKSKNIFCSENQCKSDFAFFVQKKAT